MSAALDANTLADISKEVKGLGEDTKKLSDSVQKELHDYRKAAEETKKVDALKAEEFEKFKASVLAKNEALEKEFKAEQDRADALEKRLNRPGIAGDSAEAKMLSDAVEFKKTSLAIRGQLNASFDPDTVDVEEYKAWANGFAPYLRRDERAVESKALSVGSDPDGGYLVPHATSSRITKKIWESSPLRGMATVETISTDAIEIPIDMDEVTAGWVGETEDRPETSTPKVGIQRIPVHEMYAEPRVTQKFLDDAAIDAEAWLANKVAEKFARVEASAFIVGDGIKKPRGILTYAAGDGRQKIRQINSGSAAAVTPDGIIKLVYGASGLKAEYLVNAEFLMKRATVGEVMLLKDTAGRYMWQASMLDAQLQKARPSTLMTYNIQMADDMPVVAANSLAMAFGDFRAGYTIVQRLGITVLRDNLTAKPFVKFYSRTRLGGDVVDFDAFVIQKIAA